MTEPKKTPKKRGPKEERLIIEGDPEEALDKLLSPTTENLERMEKLPLKLKWQEGDSPICEIKAAGEAPTRLTIQGQEDWFIVTGWTEGTSRGVFFDVVRTNPPKF